MRATHIDPRLLLAALAAVFAFALLAAGPTFDLSNLGLSSGGATTVDLSAAQPDATPAWVEDPMAQPLDQLRATP